MLPNYLLHWKYIVKVKEFWWTPTSGWGGNTRADNGRGIFGTGQTATWETLENGSTTPCRGTVELGNRNKGRYRSGKSRSGRIFAWFPVLVPYHFRAEYIFPSWLCPCAPLMYFGVLSSEIVIDTLYGTTPTSLNSAGARGRHRCSLG